MGVYGFAVKLCVIFMRKLFRYIVKEKSEFPDADRVKLFSLLLRYSKSSSDE